MCYAMFVTSECAVIQEQWPKLRLSSGHIYGLPIYAPKWNADRMCSTALLRRIEP